MKARSNVSHLPSQPEATREDGAYSGSLGTPGCISNHRRERVHGFDQETATEWVHCQPHPRSQLEENLPSSKRDNENSNENSDRRLNRGWKRRRGHSISPTVKQRIYSRSRSEARLNNTTTSFHPSVAQGAQKVSCSAWITHTIESRQGSRPDQFRKSGLSMQPIQEIVPGNVTELIILATMPPNRRS